MRKVISLGALTLILRKNNRELLLKDPVKDLSFPYPGVETEPKLELGTLFRAVGLFNNPKVLIQGHPCSYSILEVNHVGGINYYLVEYSMHDNTVKKVVRLSSCGRQSLLFSEGGQFVRALSENEMVVVIESGKRVD